MTTEEDFHYALGANPDDWQMRLVFADWLQDRGDPRAEGYRALGLRRWQSYVMSDRFSVANYPARSSGDDRSDLPNDWFKGVFARARPNHRVVLKESIPGNEGSWCWFGSRREAEDAAALAFAELPAKRRAELLAAPPAA
jgi:uncharacterized protein (TIGR02996 family)